MFAVQGIAREVSRQALVRETAGGRLQAWGRGVVARRVLARAEERVRKELLMTIRTQRAWRLGNFPQRD